MQSSVSICTVYVCIIIPITLKLVILKDKVGSLRTENKNKTSLFYHYLISHCKLLVSCIACIKLYMYQMTRKIKILAKYI